MYELHPYFTNDGTVGLYSRQDDDIYHSTYGALSESWEKFVLPSKLKDFVKQNDEIKILDICYGIGYNSKAALNVFVENILEEKNSANNKKKLCPTKSSIAAIDTDNISQEKNDKNLSEIEINHNYNNLNNAPIDTDNISNSKSEEFYKNDVCNDECKKKISIDAVDTDKILIGISPFIVNNIKKRNIWLSKIFPNSVSKISNDPKMDQIIKIKTSKGTFLKNEYKIRNEVQMILFEKLYKKYPMLFLDKNIVSILSSNDFTPFFSKFMLHYSTFYKNLGINHLTGLNNSSFLHNIYYRYVSKSYKNVQKLNNFAEFDINIENQDARKFVVNSKKTYNFVFLDAFTPAKCPALWTLEFFSELYKHLDENGMILTYSNAASIRHAFLQNNFSVGKIYDSKLKKFIGTIAVKNPSLIEHPLDEKDINLIHSKAGICYRDSNLNSDNESIIKMRNEEVQNSNLESSSKILKGYK